MREDADISNYLIDDFRILSPGVRYNIEDNFIKKIHLIAG